MTGAVVLMLLSSAPESAEDIRIGN